MMYRKKMLLLYSGIILSVLFVLYMGYAAENTQVSDKEMKEVKKTLEKVYKRTDGQAKAFLQEAQFVGKDFVFPVALSDDAWREKLTDEQYHILRKEGTERSFSGTYDKFYEKGVYYSAATGAAVFSSVDKFDSKTGWPSFTKAITNDAVFLKLDSSLFSTRIEVVDRSGSHLGHVFEDGPYSTGLRFCMNSLALIFVPEGELLPAKYILEEK